VLHESRAFWILGGPQFDASHGGEGIPSSLTNKTIARDLTMTILAVWQFDRLFTK